MNCPDGAVAVFQSGDWRCSSADNTNVGIGTPNPGAELEVAGNAIFGDSVTVNRDLSVPNGTIFGTVMMNPSTRRLKKNIRPLSNALDTVKKLKGVSYDWKKSGRSDIGVIAEEVNQVLPEVVGRDDEGRVVGVDYSRLTTVLIEAVKAQQAQLDQQKRQLKAQQAQLDRLLKRLP